MRSSASVCRISKAAWVELIAAGAGGELLENRQVVVARIEPVGFAVLQCPPQFAGRVRVAPRGPKRALRIERVDDVRIGDVRAVNLERPGLEQRFDLGLQLRGAAWRRCRGSCACANPIEAPATNRMACRPAAGSFCIAVDVERFACRAGDGPFISLTPRAINWGNNPALRHSPPADGANTRQFTVRIRKFQRFRVTTFSILPHCAC